MKLKTLVLTVVVLALLCAVASWVSRPPAPPPADSRVGQPVAAAAVAEKAAKLRLTDAGKSVVLTRQADGTWKDASYYDLPADFSKLTSFVSDLTSAKIQRLVTTNPQRLARLELKDSRIEFLEASDRTLFTVTLGKNADAGGRFLRFGDEPRAYLANLNVWLDSDPKSWADAALLNVKSDDIARLDVGFEAAAPVKADPAKPNAVLEKLDQLKKFGQAAVLETVTVSRAKKDAPWSTDKPRAGQRLVTDKISSLMTSLGGLRFSDTTDLNDAQAAAARAHARTFRLTTFGGVTYTIVAGRKPEEKKLKPKPPAPKPEATKAEAAKPEAAKPAEAKLTEAKPAEAKPVEATSAAPDAKTPAPDTKEAAKPAEPEYDTIPAGPVFVWVTSSDASAPVNALMKKRAFQVDEYTFTSLPQKSDDLFEAAPSAKK